MALVSTAWWGTATYCNNLHYITNATINDVVVRSANDSQRILMALGSNVQSTAMVTYSNVQVTGVGDMLQLAPKSGTSTYDTFVTFSNDWAFGRSALSNEFALQYRDPNKGFAPYNVVTINNTGDVQFSGNVGLANAYVGKEVNNNSNACFAHCNVLVNRSNYSVCQSEAGETFVNSACNRDINFRLGNVPVAGVSWADGGNLYSGSNAAHSNFGAAFLGTKSNGTHSSVCYPTVSSTSATKCIFLENPALPIRTDQTFDSRASRASMRFYEDDPSFNFYWDCGYTDKGFEVVSSRMVDQYLRLTNDFVHNTTLMNFTGAVTLQDASNATGYGGRLDIIGRSSNDSILRLAPIEYDAECSVAFFPDVARSCNALQYRVGLCSQALNVAYGGTAGAALVTIRSNGFVGIGRSNPTSVLDISGDKIALTSANSSAELKLSATSQCGARLAVSSGEWNVFAGAGLQNALTFQANSASAFVRLDAQTALCRVGVNTDAPTSALTCCGKSNDSSAGPHYRAYVEDVAGAPGPALEIAPMSYASVGINFNCAVSSNDGSLIVSDSSSQAYQLQCASNQLRVNCVASNTSASTTAMCFTGSGTIGIGTVSPFAQYKLHVDGNVYASEDIVASSDSNLKRDIRPLSNACDLISQISGYTFKRSEDGRECLGLLAQEVQRVFPQVVYTSQESGYLSIAYGNLVGALVEAVKELKAEIEVLKKKIA